MARRLVPSRVRLIEVMVERRVDARRSDVMA
jgi:hypothetical protein